MRHLTFPRVRDAALLIGGLLLIGEETLYAAEPRALLIGLAAGMIGLPATWSANKRFTIPLSPGGSEPEKTTPAAIEEPQP